jgi:hypothetical protein
LDDNDLEFKLIKNPLTRVKFINDVLNNIQLFYEYDLSETDTPEVIAHKLYDDPNRYWIVMMANNLIDPYYDLPLNDVVFDAYLIDKYGSISNSQAEIHHYERRTTITTNSDGTINTNEYVNEIQTYSFDHSNNSVIVNTLPTIGSPITVSTETDIEIANDNVIISKSVVDYAVSNYDYEFNLNENKRNIKLVRAELVDKIESEFKKLLAK